MCDHSDTDSVLSDLSPIRLDAEFVAAIRPERPMDGHKGTFGNLLVWAGSEGMAGAAFMCAEASARSGAGIVRLYLPRPLILPLLIMLPQAVSHAIPGTAEEAREDLSALLPKIDACAVGPGLDPSDIIVRDILLYMAEHAERIVLDASALTVISREPEVFRPVFLARKEKGLAPAVLTPHPGEFSRLVPGWNKEDRLLAPKTFSRDWNTVLVLKGYETTVFLPGGECYINSTGNDGMAKGGSGDVLTGLIGGLLAQGVSPADAATAGVFLHGLAGDLAVGKLGRRSMQPTDLSACFTEAFRRVKWESYEMDG